MILVILASNLYRRGNIVKITAEVLESTLATRLRDIAIMSNKRIGRWRISMEFKSQIKRIRKRRLCYSIRTCRRGLFHLRSAAIGGGERARWPRIRSVGRRVLGLAWVSRTVRILKVFWAMDKRREEVAAWKNWGIKYSLEGSKGSMPAAQTVAVVKNLKIPDNLRSARQENLRRLVRPRMRSSWMWPGHRFQDKS